MKRRTWLLEGFDDWRRRDDATKEITAGAADHTNLNDLQVKGSILDYF
jgi:hypothetical protein